jgi:antitoxin HicB
LVTEAEELADVVPNVSDALAAVIEAYEELGKELPAILAPLSKQTPLWIEPLTSVGTK